MARKNIPKITDWLRDEGLHNLESRWRIQPEKKLAKGSIIAVLSPFRYTSKSKGFHFVASIKNEAGGALPDWLSDFLHAGFKRPTIDGNKLHFLVFLEERAVRLS